MPFEMPWAKGKRIEAVIGRRNPTAVDRGRLALYLRGRGQGMPPDEVKDLSTLSEGLESLARSPDSWRDLSQEWIALLVFHQFLSHAGSDDPKHVAGIQRLYAHITSALGTPSRLALEGEIAQHFDGILTVLQETSRRSARSCLTIRTRPLSPPRRWTQRQ
jgi:hypothetical protein